MDKKHIKDILTIENDEVKLSERSMEIDTKNQAIEMREIVSSLKATMRANDLAYLSAPAIGYQRRIFAINFNDLEIKTFINPVIASAKGLHLAKETSNSIPNKTYIRPRNTEITIMYQRPTGQPESRKLVGLAADIFQQCMDDLDGILLCDIGLEIDDNWDKLTDEEKQEIIGEYLDSLDLKQKQLQKEIEDNTELKQIDDAITFMTSVYKGDTEIE